MSRQGKTNIFLEDYLSQRYLLRFGLFFVKNSPSLPSVTQKLLNERTLRFDLIICGSAQQQMHDIVLNKKEPLYGQADEIMLIRAIPARYVRQALECTAEESVTEYAVWGGVPPWEPNNTKGGCSSQKT